MWASPGRLPVMEEGDDVDAYGRTTTTRGGAAAAASCLGRLGLAALWRRLGQLRLARRRRRHGGRSSILGGGGLNYDPLSYAQNFDDGSLDPDFTARFAPPRNAGSPRPPPPGAPAPATA